MTAQLARWCILILAVTPVIAAQPLIEVTEWSVPWPHSRPRDPAVDSQGRVWFCGQAGNYLAYLDPSTGQFTQQTVLPGSYPHNLIVDSQDRIWYAGNKNGHIGRIDPATEKLTPFRMPKNQASDPHTLIANPQGEIWFTAQWANQIGRLQPGSGNIDLITVPSIHARPYGIKLAPGGTPWVALFGTNQLASIDAATLALTMVSLPSETARPRRLEITPDGHIWYVDYANGVLGSFEPASDTFKHWPLPGGKNARPYGMALSHEHYLWIAETGKQPNRLVLFDTNTQKFIATATIGSGGGSIRHMYFHPSSGEIWFGTDANTLGRARLRMSEMEKQSP